MTSSSNSKNAEWVQWIEDGIAKDYINHHDYDEFQNIQHIGYGAFGNVYRATWENRDTVVALKSFEINNYVIKEVVNEVYKVINYQLVISSQIKIIKKNVFSFFF